MSRKFVIRSPTLALLAALSGVLLHPAEVAAQDSTGSLTVHVTSEGRPVTDAVVLHDGGRTPTNSAGIARLVLAAGPRTLIVRKIGFEPDTQLVMVRAGRDTTVHVLLRPEAVELQPLVVSSTRSGGRVEEEPIRVEVIEHEDVDEKAAMSPASVAALLGETNAIRVQTTAPALGAANIRIQGMRGRYTQVLSDGLPLYGATTEGLGLLQIPPVDLDHVEVIKGIASALYGGAALGGVVDLISRTPSDGTEGLVNQTSRDASDVVLWTSRKLSERWAYSLMGSANRQSARDINGDGWADLPAYERGIIRPRLYWTGDRGQSIFVTAGATLEDREGGTRPGAVVPSGGAFPVALRTQRYDFGALGRFAGPGSSTITARASATSESLHHSYGATIERDRHTTAFSEAAFTAGRAHHLVIAGLAVQYDAYRSRDVAGFDYAFATPGVFLQDTYTASEHLALTASARVDHHRAYGTFVSPRLSVLVRPIRGLSARFSGGAGFYAPTPFTEETEPIGLSQVRPLSGIQAERASGGSADLGYVRGRFELHGTLFGSSIHRALALHDAPDSSGRLAFVNLTAPTRTSGAELIARYRNGEFMADATYSYTRSSEIEVEAGLRREVPLTPRHQAGMDLLFELEGGTRFGVEGFYVGRQSLANDPYRTRSRSYLLLGLLLQKRVGPVLVFANAENLLDARQTRHDPLLLPSPGPGGRRTTDVWAPLEGRVLNAGIRLGVRERAERRWAARDAGAC